MVLDAPDPLPPSRSESTPPPPRPGRVVAWASVIIGLALTAGLWPRWRLTHATAARTHELAIPTVMVTSPRPADPAPALPLPAEIKPQTEATLFGRASGYVHKLHVDLGSQVKAGQLLAEIDSPELDAELNQARAQLVESQAAHGLAEQTARRWRELVKNHSVSAQEDAEKQADFALKSAAVDAGQARVKRLEELKGFGRVIAPFEGTITARYTDVGDLISTETPHALFKLADTRTLRVFVRIPQTLTTLATVGVPAELTLDEKPGRHFAATLVRSAGALDPSSRTLLVELSVDNSAGEIFAGSFGQVRFPGQVTNKILSLPSNALLFRPDGPQVGVVKPDETVELRPVKLGRDSGRQVEILGGVSGNERVILNPRDSLTDHTRVRIANAPPPVGKL